MGKEQRQEFNGFVVAKLPKPNSLRKQHFDYSIYYSFNNLTANGRKVLSKIVAEALNDIFSAVAIQMDEIPNLEIHKTNNGNYTLRIKGLPFGIIEQILHEDSTKDKVLAAISDNTKIYSNI